MKNKRIFAVSSPTAIYNNKVIHGIFYALKSGVYHCIYGLTYRLLPFSGSRDTLLFGFVVGASKGDSLSYIHNLILTRQCQRQQVSGPLRSTVSAILRQQRDSLHRIQNSHSEECLRTAIPTRLPPPSGCTPFSLAPSGSASKVSVMGASASPSKPPD